MNWYMQPWQKFAQFKGRARRKEYWIFTLINVLIVIALMVVGGLLGKDAAPIVLGVCGLFYLAILIPSLACLVRRLHDTGKSGWWFFISLVPAIGGIWLLILLLMDSKPGANEYGPNPKA